MSTENSAPAVYKGINNAEGLKLLESEPITVVVGPTGNTKTWHLPKELLVNASPFFSAALNGSFAEATSKVINLPEDNADAFALFIRWLFVGKISGELFSHKDKLTGDEILDAGIDDLLDAAITLVYVQACILGDKLGCLVFHNLAMLELIDRHNDGPVRTDTIRVIYEHSGLGSKLRRFAIDAFRYDLEEGYLSKGIVSFVSTSKIAEEFGLDFLKACIEEYDGGAIMPQDHKERYVEVLTNVDKD